MVGDSLIHYINFPALAGALGSFERLRITSSSQSTQSRELYGKGWSIPSLNIHLSIFSFLSSEKPKKKSYIMIKPKLAKAVANLETPAKTPFFLPAAHLAPPNNFDLATALARPGYTINISINIVFIRNL